VAVALKASANVSAFNGSPAATNPGTAAGDLVVVVFYSDSAIPSSQTGWTFAGTVATNGILSVFWRIAGASEPGTWTFSAGAAQTGALGTLIFTGHNPTTPIVGLATNSGASSVTQTAPSVTPTVANSMLTVAFGSFSTSTYSTPAGMTKTFDKAVGSEITMSVDTQALSTTAATGTATATASVAGTWDSVAFVVSAAGSSAFTGSVALSGSGTSTLAGAPKPAATRTLSGSGTLTFSSTPRPTGSLALSGSGGLTLSAQDSLAGSVALSGSGVLTLSGMLPPVYGSLALGGAGELSFEGQGARYVFVGPVFYDYRPFQIHPPTRLVNIIPYGETVWRDSTGAWQQQYAPSLDQLAGASVVYGGGRMWPLTDQQYADLVAAGYAGYITLENFT
jgi:hypothetical protein